MRVHFLGLSRSKYKNYGLKSAAKYEKVHLKSVLIILFYGLKSVTYLKKVGLKSVGENLETSDIRAII